MDVNKRTSKRQRKLEPDVIDVGAVGKKEGLGSGGRGGRAKNGSYAGILDSWTAVDLTGVDNPPPSPAPASLKQGTRFIKMSPAEKAAIKESRAVFTSPAPRLSMDSRTEWRTSPAFTNKCGDGCEGTGTRLVEMSKLMDLLRQTGCIKCMGARIKRERAEHADEFVSCLFVN